jgi:hypothetical protein
MTHRFDYRGFAARYAAAFGERRHAGDYDIFYSQIVPSPLMIIGHNPGGSPAREAAPAQEVQDGYHEYAAHDYKLARVMRRYLGDLLGSGEAGIAAVPKINIVFARSEDANSFAEWHRQDMWAAARRDAPFVAEILRFVGPRALIFEGRHAWDKFRALHAGSEPPAEPERVFTHQPGKVRLIEIADLPVAALDRKVRCVVLAHPSRFGTWRSFRAADAEVRRHLAAAGVIP